MVRVPDFPGSIFGDTSAGASFTWSCPSGAFIVRFVGLAGAMLDAVGVVCSDGSTSGPFGGVGGSSSNTDTCQNGFSSVQIEYVTDSGWNAIGGIMVDCYGSRSSIDGYNSGDVNVFTCPAGQVLQRVRGTEGVGTGSYSHCACRVVYSLQFFCTAEGSGKCLPSCILVILRYLQL